MRVKIVILTALGLIFCSLLSAETSYIKSFLLPPETTRDDVFESSGLNFLEVQEGFEEVSYDNKYYAATLNDEAINKSLSKDFDSAIELFDEALAYNPFDAKILNNYLMVMAQKAQMTQNVKDIAFEKRLDEIALRLLAINPRNIKAALLAATIYFNSFNNYKRAAEYLHYAAKFEPNNTQITQSLVASLYATGKYRKTLIEQAFGHMRKMPQDTQTAVFLVSALFEKNKFYEAEAFLKTSPTRENDPFLAHAYVRARFSLGKHEGLLEIAQKALRKFPESDNAKSTELIINSLTPKTYLFTSTLNASLNMASELEKLTCSLPQINESERQSISLMEVAVISRNRRTILKPIAREDGSLYVDIPRSAWGTKLSIEVLRKISVKPFFKPQQAPVPDINEIIRKSGVDLTNRRLEMLYRYVNSLEGDFLINANRVVNQGLSYYENRTRYGLDWIFDNPGKCDCTEYALLFLALALKKGMPARLVNGYLIKEEMLGTDDTVGHQWLEVYENNRGWVSIDPTLYSTMHLAYHKNMLSTQIIFSVDLEAEQNAFELSSLARSDKFDFTVSHSYKFVLLQN